VCITPQDGNGYLDRSELAAALKALGMQADRATVNAVLDEMDGAGGNQPVLYAVHCDHYQTS